MTHDTLGGSRAIQTVGIPALFVVLWSTGFIGARLGLPHAEPLTFLSLRYALAAGLLVLVSAATRAPWPRRLTEVAHFAVAGLLVHGVYLGGVFLGISLGVEAGVSALIVGLQPLLTAALAGVLLGERVRPRQWLGLVLGLCGVTLVLVGNVGYSIQEGRCEGQKLRRKYYRISPRIPCRLQKPFPPFVPELAA